MYIIAPSNQAWPSVDDKISPRCVSSMVLRLLWLFSVSRSKICRRRRQRAEETYRRRMMSWY